MKPVQQSIVFTTSKMKRSASWPPKTSKNHFFFKVKNNLEQKNGAATALSQRDIEIIKTITGTVFHDVPNDGMSADFDHGFGADFSHITESCAQSACQYDNLHD